MKKRFLIFFLALVMLCTMAIGASAATMEGLTSGGSNGKARAVANLTLSLIDAVATTWSGAGDTAILQTSVNFTYINTFDHRVTVSSSGSALASVAPNNLKDATSAISAQSQHSVKGGALWGSWSYTLSEFR